MHTVEDVCQATWFVRYDGTNTNGKDITMTTTTTNNNTTTPTTPQPQIEYKEDGTTVRSAYLLYPMTNTIDVQNIEALYQTIVQQQQQQPQQPQANTSSNNNNQSILHPEIDIEHGAYKVQVQYKNGTFSLRKVPNEKGWMSNIVQQFKTSSFTLQRGYSPYNVVGEDMELALGPVRHVVFVIHGIGEALFHRTDIQITGMIQQTSQLRRIIQTKQYTTWQKQCSAVMAKQQKHKLNSTTTSTTTLELPPPPNRIEFIPIEWYHCLHGPTSTDPNHQSTSSSSTDDLMRNLQLVTLQTIPALRTIANDVLLDVLLYCTPTFCSIVLQTVTQQINQYYHTLIHDVFPDFVSNGGKVSMMGHSLGSVILWDLLATAKQQREQLLQNNKNKNDNDKNSNNMNNMSSPTEATQSAATNTGTSSDPHPTASYGPSVLPPMTDIIPFVPEYSILLGSPMGMFLSLRNASQLFHVVSSEGMGPASHISSFTLPTNQLYNIFHPSDPVAYRIEPLLLRPTSSLYSNLPEPVYLTVPGEDVRLHVKAIQFTNVVRKSLFSSSSHSDHGKARHKNSTANTTLNSWTSLLESAIANVSSTQTQPGSSRDNDTTNDVKVPPTTVPTTSTRDGNTTTTGTSAHSLQFPLGGKQNPRIDYCLQPLIVDNEYISAVTAHSSYFTNTDIQDFLIGIL